MKRKLDVNDAPTLEVSPSKSISEKEPTIPISFTSFNLDPRLLQAIANLKFLEPTPVQQRVIPLALEGKDIFAKSETGTGKTAAYILPIVQDILLRKSNNPKSRGTAALVLVPSRELSEQVAQSFASFAEYCSKDIKILNLAQRLSDAVLNAKLHDLPDIVVSTPGRANQLVENGVLSLESLTKFVIDEADRVLEYDGGDDIHNLSKALPQGVQTFLVSATLRPEVDQLRNTIARDPVFVKIDETADEPRKITQLVVTCGEEEKFLLIFVIFKLKLVTGKCIIFVADVDRSYRVKLYLEQYGIRSCVLNSELPVNSRMHTMEEFNKGLYDILIAADDQEVMDGVHKTLSDTGDQGHSRNELDDEDPALVMPVSKKPKVSSNKDFGVSRGVDFHNVSWILNFDLPTSSKSYTHRIGRTARAGRSGTAISFVVPRSEYNKHKATTHPSTRNNEKVLAKIKERQSKKGNALKDYKFDNEAISGFRYRMNDALRAVTRVAVREARAREIKSELVRSEKLRKHFEDNPEDLRHLQRRDGGQLGGGGVVRVQGHLKHVPDYLMPNATTELPKDNEGGMARLNSDANQHKRKKTSGFRKGRKGFVRGGKKNDPLKTFKSGRK